MIKIKYPDNIEDFKKKYLKIFKIDELRLTSDAILRELSISNVEDILIADFRQLVEYCQRYKALNKTKEESQKLLDKVFRYDKYYDKIAQFFIKNLNISTCCYCEMSYVNAYTKTQKGKKQTKRQFDLDHIIPKSKYPIVALSLFNFAPSCKVCNSKTVKGSKEYIDIDNINEAILLSPSSNDYNFENDVNITVVPTRSGISSSPTYFMKHQDEFKIDFFANNPIYNKEIDSFQLRERYDYHKVLALNLLDKQAEYPESNIQKISEITGKTPDEIREAIFNEKFINEHHRTFAKLYKDIMKIYKQNNQQ